MNRCMAKGAELKACVPAALDPKGFNLDAKLPFGLSWMHIRTAMNEMKMP